MSTKYALYEGENKQRIGRPSRVESVAIRFTEDEVAVLAGAAAAKATTLREWSREVLLREARRVDSDPVFTELIAMRMFLNLVLKHVACGEKVAEETYTAILTKVRTGKHKQALDVLQQYTSNDEKES
jgi:hypothetical protein